MSNPTAKEKISDKKTVDWERARQLRGVKRIASALKDLGMPRLNLLLPGKRTGDSQNTYFEHFFINEELRVFCKFVQSTPKGFKRCQDTCFCTHQLGNGEKPRTIKHQCHAGLTNLVTPIMLEGKQAGNLGLGQFVESVDDASKEIILEKIEDLGLDAAKAKKCLTEVPLVSDEKAEILSTLLQSMGGEIHAFQAEQVHEHEKRDTEQFSNYYGILSRSKEMKRVLGQIPDIAKSNSSVMIYGESGTGKEKLASIIHQLSTRKDNDLVTINCAALTDTLLEAELFGFKKGAFTNAYSDKAGLFEKADKGTMFLDEIGDMPQTLQVKLLRVLQEGTFIKVGDTNVQKVDVRIIAATNKNIPEMVKRGDFRQDLYYRLAVIELNLPSLRERKEDIEVLISHFVVEYCERMGKAGIKISPESMNFLMAYEWPGNIRELKNEIERAVALASSHTVIQPEHLSKRLTDIQPRFEAVPGDQRTIKEIVAEFEKALLLKALQDDKWNKTRISEKLGLTRQGLIKKIEKYQLDKRRK